MTTHHMHLHPEPFSRIESGEKNIEYRLNDEKRKRVRIGDVIQFVHRDDEARIINVEVVTLHHAATFPELVNDTATLRALAQYYTTDDQRKFGVLGIEFTLL